MPSERQKVRDLIFDQFKLGVKPSEAAKNIQAVTGKSSPDRSTCWRWYQKFQDGQLSIQDKQRKGRPSSVNTKRLRKFLETNPQQTTRALAAEFATSKSTIARQLRSMGKSGKKNNTISMVETDSDLPFLK